MSSPESEESLPPDLTEREKFDIRRKEASRTFWLQTWERLAVVAAVGVLGYLCGLYLDRQRVALEEQKISSQIELEKLRVDNETRLIAFGREKDVLVTYLDAAKEKDLGIWLRSLDVIDVVSQDERTKSWVEGQREKYNLEFLYQESVTSLEDRITSMTLQLRKGQARIAQVRMAEIQHRIRANILERTVLLYQIDALKNGNYSATDFGFRIDPRVEKEELLMKNLENLVIIGRLIPLLTSNDNNLLLELNESTRNLQAKIIEIEKRTKEVDHQIELLGLAAAEKIGELKHRVKVLEKDNDSLEDDLATAKQEFSTLSKTARP